MIDYEFEDIPVIKNGEIDFVTVSVEITHYEPGRPPRMTGHPDDRDDGWDEEIEYKIKHAETGEEVELATDEMTEDEFTEMLLAEKKAVESDWW
jgi:hypothetical protein